MQYYVAARQAKWCQFLPVYASLFHHAFEMLFKAKFVGLEVSDDDIWERYGHSLRKVWADFKAVATGSPAGPAPELNKFDRVVHRLDGCEEQRYPSFAGSRSVFMLGSPPANVSTKNRGSAARGAATFTIDVNDMDKLFAAAINAYPLTPSWVGSWLSVHRDALEIYERENKHRIAG